jgi:hypothetical protein
MGQPSGAGGEGSEVVGRVSNGGDGRLSILSDKPSIHADTQLVLTEGSGGLLMNASAYGKSGGRSSGHAPHTGYRIEEIPMSETILWEPPHNAKVSIPPTFQWMPLFRSSSNGAVKEFILEVDGDSSFDDPDVYITLKNDHITLNDLPMGTYHWRVTAIYSRPIGVNGPTPEPSIFKFYNSPPRVLVTPKVRVEERVPTSIYIGNYVNDQDNGFSELILQCNHSAVTSVMNLFMMLYYPQWIPDHSISYNVSDGTSTVTGRILVEVIDVNEAPEFISIDGKPPPIFIELEERQGIQLRILANDPDGDPLTFIVMEEDLEAHVSSTGMLSFRSAGDDLGTYRFTIIADDGRGGKAGTKVRVEVINARDPPNSPEIFGPKNHSRFRRGQDVTFTVKVSDPDIEFGDVLTVEWASNRSGSLGVVSTQDTATMTTNRLQVGVHRIFITVSDGTFQVQDWIEVTIVEAPEPSTPPSESNIGLYLLAILLFGLMLGIGFWAGLRGTRDRLEVSR